MCSPKSAAKISAESNPPLHRVFVIVSSLPVFSLLLRSRRSSSFVVSCFLCVANLHRTFCRAAVRPLPSQARVGLPRFQSRPQVSSHRAPKRPCAFGSRSTALNRQTEQLRPSPAMAPPQAPLTLVGHSPLSRPDLFWIIQSRSNGLYRRIPLRPHILQKSPPGF